MVIFSFTLSDGQSCSLAVQSNHVRVVQVYLVAEDKVIKVTPRNVHTSKPASEVFFSHNATSSGRSEEIIGLAVSGSYSSLFLTIRNRGLFAFSLRGELQWSAGPALDFFGYRLGCKRNVSGCYFDSAPVVDQCEGVLYVRSTPVAYIIVLSTFCASSLCTSHVLTDIQH